MASLFMLTLICLLMVTLVSLIMLTMASSITSKNGLSDCVSNDVFALRTASLLMRTHIAWGGKPQASWHDQTLFDRAGSKKITLRKTGSGGLVQTPTRRLGACASNPALFDARPCIASHDRGKRLEMKGHLRVALRFPITARSQDGFSSPWVTKKYFIATKSSEHYCRPKGEFLAGVHLGNRLACAPDDAFTDVQSAPGKATARCIS
jgi:hypothetical protein